MPTGRLENPSAVVQKARALIDNPAVPDAAQFANDLRARGLEMLVFDCGDKPSTQRVAAALDQLADARALLGDLLALVEDGQRLLTHYEGFCACPDCETCQEVCRLLQHAHCDHSGAPHSDNEHATK